MAGSVLAVGALAVTAALAAGLAVAGAAAVHAVRLSGAADAAALAAADAAMGAVPGIPCEQAAAVVRAAGMQLTECAAAGPIVTVRVEAPFGVFPAAARARAGPPPAS